MPIATPQPRSSPQRPWQVTLALLAGALLLPSGLAADVYFLLNGDRVTGQTVSTEEMVFTIDTAFGRLKIPRDEIDRIVFSDGREELLRARPELPGTVRLILIITGHNFWQAWDPSEVLDWSLRLEVRLGEATIATFLDRTEDPEDLRGAVVNTFSFEARDVRASALGGAVLLAPEVRPGKVVVKLDLPADRAGQRRLELTYQVNDGSRSRPEWSDAATAAVWLTLSRERPAYVQVRQDQGEMKYSGFRHRSMRNTESFRLMVAPEEP